MFYNPEIYQWSDSSSLAIHIATVVSSYSHSLHSSPPLTPTTNLSPLPRKLKTFTSPPLLPGLVRCLQGLLGEAARPTAIQGLSLDHVTQTQTVEAKEPTYRQFLLASETGSGKSIAYLLPVLQSLKIGEMGMRKALGSSSLLLLLLLLLLLALNPRALILAPTHELSRQLSGSVKALLHQVKLWVLCASQANVGVRVKVGSKQTNSRMKREVEQAEREVKQAEREVEKADQETDSGEFLVTPPSKTSSFPVDVVVGTPMKVMEMVRGRGWDRKLRCGRDVGKMPGPGKWTTGKPEMGLGNVEWVVVDEADVLFDPDFLQVTQLLLADIARVRGVSVGEIPVRFMGGSSAATGTLSTDSTKLVAPQYPFNLILSTATVPQHLSAYLKTYHPGMRMLISPKVHHFPGTVEVEYSPWSGGNKMVDVEMRVRRVWKEDVEGGYASTPTSPHLSKIIIFCNKSTKVHALSAFLTDRGITNVAVTSGSRRRGSNKHLKGFLKQHATQTIQPIVPPKMRSDSNFSAISASSASLALARSIAESPATTPYVLLTMSLLSRGLDFSPEIKHVFIVDEPRNLVDFLHRAGRVGWAGEKGKVVVFGSHERPARGRGSLREREVRERVGELRLR
ncbi:P-loop containing nucleoside triphosphate hydrolase protein [Mycena floridula]|nr:P-loop containing nucleoside triphosphate hydrolase protein [Mycena floridula]